MMEQLSNILNQKEALARVTQSRHTFSYFCQKFYFFLLKKHAEKKVQKYLNTALYCICRRYDVLSEDVQPIENLVEIFNTFSLSSALKPNLKKCEMAGIGALNRVHVAVCGMRCIDLCNEAIKILGNYFSYNSRIKQEYNFLKIVPNVQRALNLWGYRNLTLEGRIVVFKSLTILKIVFQALIAPVPTHVIKALETIQTSF